jgi:hypothetical protein
LKRLYSFFNNNNNNNKTLNLSNCWWSAVCVFSFHMCVCVQVCTFVCVVCTRALFSTDWFTDLFYVCSSRTDALWTCEYRTLYMKARDTKYWKLSNELLICLWGSMITGMQSL